MFMKLVSDVLKIALQEQIFSSLQEALHVPSIEVQLNPDFHKKEQLFLVLLKIDFICPVLSCQSKT